ncbi:kinase-like domain-containing protein [Umbelopsis sp. PMI_123]|nr:kinase-like domain-containing protein [Umbelopsis sp. PMI_123]
MLSGTNLRKQSSLGNIQSSQHGRQTIRQSKSEPATTTQLTRIDAKAQRRCTTGSLKHTASLSRSTNSSRSNLKQEIWRPPGNYEIPDILGKAFLKPTLMPSELAATLRAYNPTKNVSKRPWYPPSSHATIPNLQPVVRKNDFEARIRKALPKFAVASADPRSMYQGFSEIGTGVNGSVVRATHRKRNNLQLAIKRCRLDPDREYRAAILRELRIMATGHQNLIRLREVSVWKNDIWMAMDLMHCSVFSVLCQRGIPEAYVVYITSETLKALAFLHDKGFLHRDVKCENLLLGWNGEVKLADFGLSARTNKRHRDRLGTSKWMAPEVIREQYYNERIDMWSLGITIIEMMDRVPPHYLIKDEEELFDVVLSEPSPTFTYSYPTMYMRGLVAWLLEEDPRTRPSARDVLYEIDAHVQSELLQRASAHHLSQFLYQVLPQY